jgi:hypothetical protein
VLLHASGRTAEQARLPSLVPLPRFSSRQSGVIRCKATEGERSSAGIASVYGDPDPALIPQRSYRLFVLCHVESSNGSLPRRIEPDCAHLLESSTQVWRKIGHTSLRRKVIPLASYNDPPRLYETSVVFLQFGE